MRFGRHPYSIGRPSWQEAGEEISKRPAKNPMRTNLGQAIDPVSSGTKESDLLFRNSIGNELVDGVRDEEIGLLDTAPQIVPNFRLRRAIDVDEVGADLDVRAIDDRDAWTGFLDQWDKTGHLGVIDEDNICSSFRLR